MIMTGGTRTVVMGTRKERGKEEEITVFTSL